MQSSKEKKMKEPEVEDLPLRFALENQRILRKVVVSASWKFINEYCDEFLKLANVKIDKNAATAFI